MSACACGGLKLISGIILNCFSTLFNEAVSQSHPELADMDSHAGQIAPGSLFPLLSWVLETQNLFLTAG